MRVAILACLFLAGCATTAPAPPVSAPTCLALKTYSPADQKVLASALDALPAGSPLVGAMTDYAALRAADRACIASLPKASQ